MAQTKEQIKAPEKNTTKCQRDSQRIRCTVQNTGNQDAYRNAEYGRKLEEKVKAMLSEIKENVQGTNSDGKETGTQINGVDQEEERNIQPEKNEEQRIQKSEERLRNLQDILKRSNIQIIGVPEVEEEEQENENLFEKIMRENFPNLAKEIDFQEVQEAQRVLKKLDPRKHTPRHIIIILPKMKEKERILKAEREKETVTYKGVPIDYQLISQKKPHRQEGDGK